MRTWGYVLLCLFLPVAWGVVSARLFDWFQARGDKSTSPPDDEEMYYI